MNGVYTIGVARGGMPAKGSETIGVEWGGVRQEDKKPSISPRKTKKEDVGSTHGARGQEDQLRGAEEKR